MTIIIFLATFLFHYGYQKFPNFLTAILFPVNESLFEHLKLIYVTEILISVIIYYFLKHKGIIINNFYFGLLLSTIFNIILFYLIYLPIYNRFGQNLVVTMIIYFITLSLSQYLFYMISKRKEKNINQYISILIIPIFWLILIYFTFNPLKTDFFFDPIKEIYGISSN